MMHAARLSAILLVVIMSLPIGAPLVAAQSGDIPVQGVFYAASDGAFPYQAKMNWANASDMRLSNYNLTWAPEYLANPDITGITVTPFPAPAIIRENGTSMESVQRVRFTENDVLDGVSQSWWRAPIGNIPPGATVTMSIYRADSSTLNVTAISGGAPVFDNASLEQQIWTITLNTGTARPFQYRTSCFPQLPNLIGGWTDTNVSSTIHATETLATPPTNVNQGDPPFAGFNNVAPVRYAYWDWNLTAAGVPACSFIQQANFSIEQSNTWCGPVTPCGLNVPYALSLYRVARAWDPATITWDNQPGIVPDTLATNTTIPILTGALQYCVPAVNHYLYGAQFCNGRIGFNVTKAVQADSESTSNGVTMRIAGTIGMPFFAPTQDVVANPPWPAQVVPYLNVRWAPSTISYNFSYLSVYAPLFPNKDYWAYWHVTYPSTHGFYLYYTPGDMNNDGLYQSWLRVNSGATQSIPVDMDESVVMSRGMSSGIAGIGLDCSLYGAVCVNNPLGFNPNADRALWYYNAWVGNQTLTNSPGAYVYANAVLPFISTRGNKSLAGNVTISLYFSDASAVAFPCLGGPCPVYRVYWNSTFSKEVTSVNVSAFAAANPAYLGKHIVSMVYEILLNNYALGGWAYLSARNDTRSVQLCPFSLITSPCVIMNFGLYGYFSIDNFFFTNTDKSIILVPVQQPNSEIGILQAWQQWQAQASAANAFNGFTCDIAFVLGPTGIGTIPALIINHDCAVQGAMAFQTWILHTIYEPLARFFSPLTNFLYGIGAFIWDILTFLVKAIQWFLYWGIKFINIFIVMCVWVVVFMAPFYVGKAFHAFAKKGMDAEAMKEVFKEGWTNTWSIIGLILSFATIAITSIAAVIGVLKP